MGVNAFEVEEKLEMERLSVDPKIEKNQVDKLKKLRLERNTNRVNELLSNLDNISKSDQNLMPVLIECVENDITLGEICGVLRQSWGEYQPSAWI